MDSNELIEASAGTGKTEALARRLIALIRGDVKPQEIVALTFSRAAAGEIFERFVTLLAKDSAADPTSARLLRSVIETQHLSQIGTLDSFLMRIVRAFPLELGICGRLEMMDDYQAASERSRVSFGILRRTDAKLKRAFGDAFSLAMNRENVRSFTEAYRSFISAWHELYLSRPDPAAWGDVARLGLAPSDDRDWGTSAALSAAADSLVGIVDSPKWLEFVEWIRNFRGKMGKLTGFAKPVFEAENLFEGATVEFSFSRRHYAFGGREAAAIRSAVRAVLDYLLRMKVEMARGIFTLVSSFEADYAKNVRAGGHLVFADVPRLISALGEDERLALEYRMDAHIRAWALDEFQDTSREQWRALTGLLDEAKQSAGEKSVFVVGDRKQAIYGWRNGDVGIFSAERESGAYVTKALNKSWRYGKPIVQAINRIFVEGRLRDEFPRWESPAHETAKPDLSGFVQAVEARGRYPKDFVEPVYNALKAVDPVSRGISAAVLVRGNKLGELLAAELKRRGLKDVVWEGESAILDTPALQPFLDTLALADHPGDSQAYEHFRRSPLAAARYGADVPDAVALSTEFATAFVSKGIVRTFRALRACLPEDPTKAWSEFTESRFTDMLRAAAEFELSLEPGVRLGDFVNFLAAKTKRNVAEAGKIKIMTIHRSKGLGFDYVVLPLYEKDGLNTEPKGPLVADDWVLPDPGKAVDRVLPGLRDAWQLRKDRDEQESLCVYYVAMTRAKRAMTIVMHPAAEKTSSVRFSDFVREALPEPIGDPAWHLAFEPAASTEERRSETPPPVERGKRHRVSRRLPSLSFHTGESAGNLFLKSNVRKAAIDRGVAEHEALSKIEWIEADQARNDFERALVKPEGFVALWRERAFELFADGAWMSGRFDRVVFTTDGAQVIDFKTNRVRRDESRQDFESRMRAAYAEQMQAYKLAVSRLTGLKMEKIGAKLLLSDTKSVIMV